MRDTVEFQYEVGTEVKRVRIERDAGIYRVVVDDRMYNVQVSHRRSDEVTFVVEGQQHVAYVAADGSTRYVAIDGDVLEVSVPDVRRLRRQKHRQSEDSLSAIMPGQVAKVFVNVGDVVKFGQPLLILEAMKMEIKIAAPHDGRVTKVSVKQGQMVDRAQTLLEISSAT